MNSTTLVTAAGITLLGMSGSFADAVSDPAQNNKAPQKSQKAQNQKKQTQPERDQTEKNNRQRIEFNQNQSQRYNSKEDQTVTEKPVNVNNEEAKDDKSTDTPLKIDEQPVGGENSPRKFILRDNNGNRIDDKGQANAKNGRADVEKPNSKKQGGPETNKKTLSDNNKEDVFSDERRARTSTFFGKYNGQKYGLPSSMSDQYRAEEIPEAWKNRSIQRGYQVPADFQPLLVAASPDLVELLGETRDGYNYYLAGSNLVAIDSDYEVIDVIYLPTVGI